MPSLLQDASEVFPFNWLPQRVGPKRELLDVIEGLIWVSIQLVAPASGAFGRAGGKPSEMDGFVSIQLVAPASGASVEAIGMCDYNRVSIQLVAPASGAIAKGRVRSSVTRFPFNWLPQRVGPRFDDATLTARV